MSEKTICTYLESFLQEVENFSRSEDSSTIPYDTNKLMKIIQNKQVVDVCNIDSDTMIVFEDIYHSLAQIVSHLLINVQPGLLVDYQKLEQQIEENFSGNFYLYVRQTALSVKALYYYKIREYKKAFSITLECIALNEHLVHKGIHTLIHRCSEQNKNIALIHFREGDDESGYRLLRILFTYLLNGNDMGLLGNVFNNKLYWEKSPVIRESYTYELFTLTVEDVLRFKAKTPEIFPISWYAEIEFDVNKPDRQVIYNWMYINNQLHCHKYEEYIVSLIYYLKQPISLSYDALKIYLLHDLCKVATLVDFEHKQRLFDKLTEYCTTKLKPHKRLLANTIFNAQYYTLK